MENLRNAIKLAFASGNRSWSIPSPVRLPNEPESDIVQVRGDDGVFQQGRIVGCAEGGLLIDWECEGTPGSNFVAFGEIYLHREQESWKKHLLGTREQVPVQVLIRWRRHVRTWYPGMLIIGERCHYKIDGYPSSVGCYLVKAALPDGVKKLVVVPTQRIRRPLTEDELDVLRVQNGHFFTQTLDLPEVLRLGGHFAQQMVTTLNRNIERNRTTHRVRTLIRAVSMDDKTLTCIRIGYGIVPEQDQHHEPEEMRNLLLQAADLYIEPANPANWQRKRTLSETEPESSANEADSSESEVDDEIHCLPKHILVGIFDQFDRVEQCRLRQVCADWNRLLTSQYIVRIYNPNRQQSCMSLASLHDGWTQRTKIIINQGVDAPYVSLLCGGRVFQSLAQKCGHGTVNTIVMVDVTWSAVKDIGESFTISFGRLVEELNGMAAVCHSLLFRRVTVRVQNWELDHALVPTVLHFVTGQIRGSLSVKQLWERMENSLPVLTPTQWQELSDRIRTRLQWNTHHQLTFLHILNDRQSNDPRDDAHYRGRVWTAADVGTVDMRKLSKLTLHNLAAMTSFNPITITLSW